MLIRHKLPGAVIDAVLFDFDGTISTLRSGWEKVMAPLMIEVLSECPGSPGGRELERLVERYIDESTGIQTIFQMKWLAETVKEFGRTPLDPWEYKAEYNRRLMINVEKKKQDLFNGISEPDEYLMEGSVHFLRMLREAGVSIYVASGTDHCDVIQEATALKVIDLFDEIAGAPEHQENCSKEAVLKKLIADRQLRGNSICVIGDGKVEITLGNAVGALTIGIASDENARHGINPVKQDRLIKADADIITGDFLETGELMSIIKAEKDHELH